MDTLTYLPLRPWFAVPAILTIGVLLFRRFQLLFQLRHIKGPLLWRLSGIPHSLALLSGDCHNLYAELHRKYGEIVIVSPSMIITSSPDLWARSNTFPGYKKSQWFYRAVRFDWREDNLFTQTDTEKHDQRRKQMIRGYSGVENLTLEADVEACVVKLLNLIRTRYAGQRKAMDLAQKTHFFTIDVISMIGFGKCYNLLDEDDDPDEFRKSLHHGLVGTHRQVALGTWWMNWIPFLGSKPKLDIDSNTGFCKMLALNQSMVEAREKEFHEQKSLGSVPRQDMLTSFMKRGLLGDELKTENLLQVVAGSDTTSGAFNGILLFMLTNPPCYKALQAEIDDAVASGKAPRAPEVITWAQAKALEYLQAVIMEGFRMFPPVNNQNSRDVPPGGDTVTIEGEEVFLPHGLKVIPSYVAMHRNKNVYGDVDVDVFRPERWLEEADETKRRLAAMKHEVNLGFGHGRWLCLGKAIAMRELSIVLFELFRHFDWKLVNPEKPWKHKVLMGLRMLSLIS
ncbi:cytochrome protein [Xylaria bambusicola]|uniref:cytochrome protein n=1 Tax=Xylaria bambusicola TaxID=326684 RepID=UPI0020075E3C|nr:cytochrome protein [Xylaria bambusicola]KAI0512742.1 cytochrome protein [Xylaria bambusicola]